jgi:hypothetical protein
MAAQESGTIAVYSENHTKATNALARAKWKAGEILQKTQKETPWP